MKTLKKDELVKLVQELEERNLELERESEYFAHELSEAQKKLDEYENDDYWEEFFSNGYTQKRVQQICDYLNNSHFPLHSELDKIENFIKSLV